MSSILSISSVAEVQGKLSPAVWLVDPTDAIDEVGLPPLRLRRNRGGPILSIASTASMKGRSSWKPPPCSGQGAEV